MVDAIGPGKVSSIAKTKAIETSTAKRAKAGRDTPAHDTAEEEKEKSRLGTNIDERC